MSGSGSEDSTSVKELGEPTYKPIGFGEVLEDIPGLKEFLNRGDFLIYPRDHSERHPIKSLEKKVLYYAKFRRMGPVNTYEPYKHRAVVKNKRSREILSFTRILEGAIDENITTKMSMVVTVVPDIQIGRVIKGEEKMMYEVVDPKGYVLYHIEKLQSGLRQHRYDTIMLTDGTKIGTIGRNKGKKHAIRIPVGLPMAHKVLIIAYTIHKQNELYVDYE